MYISILGYTFIVWVINSIFVVIMQIEYLSLFN